MKKPPNRANDKGAYGEQLSFLPTPEFCPLLPKHGSQAAQALADLMERDITQIEWLADGKGWRLAAAIKVLDYLGWEPKSIRVDRGGKRRVSLYGFHAKAKAAYYALTRGVDADGK